jgi:hypothetical protein
MRTTSEKAIIHGKGEYVIRDTHVTRPAGATGAGTTIALMAPNIPKDKLTPYLRDFRLSPPNLT